MSRVIQAANAIDKRRPTRGLWLHAEEAYIPRTDEDDWRGAENAGPKNARLEIDGLGFARLENAGSKYEGLATLVSV